MDQEGRELIEGDAEERSGCMSEDTSEETAERNAALVLRSAGAEGNGAKDPDPQEGKAIDADLASFFSLDMAVNRDRFFEAEFAREVGYVPELSIEEALQVAEEELVNAITDKVLDLALLEQGSDERCFNLYEVVLATPDMSQLRKECLDDALFIELYSYFSNDPSHALPIQESDTLATYPIIPREVEGKERAVIEEIEYARELLKMLPHWRERKDRMRAVGDLLIRSGERKIRDERGRQFELKISGWKRTRSYYDALTTIGAGVTLGNYGTGDNSILFSHPIALIRLKDPSLVSRDLKRWYDPRTACEIAQQYLEDEIAAQPVTDEDFAMLSEKATSFGLPFSEVDLRESTSIVIARINALLEELTDGYVDHTKSYLIQHLPDEIPDKVHSPEALSDFTEEELEEIYDMAQKRLALYYCLKNLSPEDFGRVASSEPPSLDDLLAILRK